MLLVSWPWNSGGGLREAVDKGQLDIRLWAMDLTLSYRTGCPRVHQQQVVSRTLRAETSLRAGLAMITARLRDRCVAVPYAP